MSLQTLRDLSVKQLTRAAKIKARIEKLESQLNGLLGVSRSVTTAPTGALPAGRTMRRRRRKMSAAAKAKIAAAARKRWAKWRAEKK